MPRQARAKTTMTKASKIVNAIVDIRGYLYDGLKIPIA
jgi:hypothetical protein